MALRVACSANVRSLGLATIMYADENNDVIMAQGRNSGMAAGDFSFNSSLLEFFHQYLNVSNRYTGSMWTGDIPPLTVPENEVNYNVINHTPGVLICPGTEAQRSYSDLTYAYYTGSCFPWAAPYHFGVMRLAQLQNAGRVPTDNNVPIPDGLPALWGDRYVLANYNVLSVLDTGHPGVGIGQGGGGNVGRVDGSVVWMPLITANIASGGSIDRTATGYIINGGAVGQIVAIPSNAIYFSSNGSDNVIPIGTSGSVLITGSTITPIAQMFPAAQ